MSESEPVSVDQEPIFIQSYEAVLLEPSDFPLSSSFAVELFRLGDYPGRSMRYRAADLDISVGFVWWDDLDDKFRDWTMDDIPRGTFENPFFDVDQCWEVLVCEQDGEVFTAEGDGEGMYRARFRVPLERYLESWRQVLAEVQAPR